MDLLISQGFWVDRQQTGGEEGGPGVAGIPVSRGGLLGEGNVTPLQCSCLENPRDGGAWWAAVCGVTQSRTRLKRLSSSSTPICLKARQRFLSMKVPSQYQKRKDKLSSETRS